MAAMMCLRELPASNGAGPVGAKHLVATMNRSRLPRSQRPRISSVMPRVLRSPPSGYESELSMKSMPPSAARSRMATAVLSSDCSPKVIVPRQSLETCRPVRPSLTCSIAARYRPGLRTRDWAADTSVQPPRSYWVVENSGGGCLAVVEVEGGGQATVR